MAAEVADAEAERECRICRGEDEPGRPLLHPCRCSGSIKYTHQECLENWLAQSGSNRCELCNHSFRFEPLYQPNTPSALPTIEFLIGTLVLARKTLKTAARIALVFTVWLFCLPVGTCWTWYALFINSPSQLPALIASRGPAGVATDAFYGFLLSAGIVFVFLGVSTLRVFIHHAHGWDNILDEDIPHNIDVDVQPNDVAEGENRPQNNRNLQHIDNEIFDPDNNDDIDQDDLSEDENDEVFDEMDELVRDTIDVFARGDESDEEIGDEDPLLDDDSIDDDDDSFHDHHVDIGDGIRRVPNGFRDDYEESDSDYSDDDEYNIQELDNDLNAPLHEDNNDHPIDNVANNENNDAQDGQGEGGVLFGIFDLDPEDVPLEEVVGLRGHLRNLVDNAVTVLISNAIFLGVFTLIPLLIGRLTVRLLLTPALPSLRYLAEMLSKIDMFKSLSNEFGVQAMIKSETVPTVTKKAEVAVENITNAFTEKNPFSSLLSNQDPLSTSVSEATAGQLPVSLQITETPTIDQPIVSYVNNLLIVLLGYGMIALLALSYIGVMSLLRRKYPRLDSPLTKQVARMLRYVATFVKVVVLILFEYGIFPLGCGWWLDMCTLDILGGTIQSRLSYCHDSPWMCTSLHWFLGITYMVHISLFISLLREILRPELLWFLRNPEDPDFHPFRELVERPLSRHARRLCMSTLIYVPLVAALVYTPGQICLKLLPNVFPFRSEDFSHILIDVPFGNLVVGPLIRLLYLGRPGISLRKVVSSWIRWTSKLLGIEDLVVRDNPNDNQNIHREREQQPQQQQEQEQRDLLAAPENQVGLRQRRRGPEPHDELNNTENTEALSEDSNSDISDYINDNSEPRRLLRLRAITMITTAWMALVLVESASLALPTILGRSLMGTLGLPVRHDLHPFLLGLNIILGSISTMSKLWKYVQTVDTMTILSMGLPYMYKGGKVMIIFSIWLGAIPLATGILFELVLVPVRVPHNETPYFSLHQDWALGLLLLKVWSCIAVTGGLGQAWRERILRAREGDMMTQIQNFERTMKEVVIPVLLSVLTALSLPYSFTHGLLPLLGATKWITDLMYRYAYLVIACLYCGYESLRYSISLLWDLHDSIRDDKYLVGKQLYNFNESADTEQTES